MSAVAFCMPPCNLFGKGVLVQAMDQIKDAGFKSILIVTDEGIVKLGLSDKVKKMLEERDMKVEVYSKVQPNPTVSNVNDGLAIARKADSDAIVSLGGGSPHDCAKGIALLATNGGEILDYMGMNLSKKPQLPLIAINTTAGTASEMSQFAVITEETNHLKLAMADKNITPMLSVNDPELMYGMPASLTAATGMDAMTHAVEAYVSTLANPISDACSLQSMKLCAEYLERAVKNGNDEEAREKMAYAEFLAGMAFNTACLGYVHAMAHQIGSTYNIAHGVCNAVLLPHVQRFNAKVAADRLATVAEYLGASEHTAEGAVQFLQDMVARVGIPVHLKDLGVKREDFDMLATNAMHDASTFSNPIQPTHDEVKQIFEEAF
ncbi:alcohol dehydrogenase Adh4 [Schizosaccharomyces japonicus yFS275]|uniref:Alcohol dehydrogenase 4 n=1 Tax=Schizosaccharomyces japonicus (strain yFS275 / FY16936) TaxID=402676 RepID=B6K555_SCHJY|nr:alcohol dehydrogenase Adh4 [Schizosaccharomyces japonicus yFS275]EEB08659.1 alcohol dehydrogenase Adh4 [Schizosaccharomyces japonicus yFS275]